MNEIRHQRAPARLALLACGSLAALAFAAPARADETSSKPVISAPATQVDEVIVTAQKKSENLLDVGFKVESVSAETLRQARASNTSDLVNLVPNLDVKDNIPGAQAIVSIRGVGLNDFSSTNNSTVGVYVDDVFLASFAEMDFNFYDLERVEVLKGPQGTLYGRNSTAGAINVIAAAPSLGGNSGAISASYGNYKTFEADGFLNLTVSDHFALRFSAKTVQQDEGWWRSRVTHQDLGDQNIVLGRVQALWEPDGATTVKLKLEGERNRSSLGVGKFFGTIPVPGYTGACPNFTAPSNCVDQHGYTDTTSDSFTGDWNHAAPLKVDSFNATLHIDRDLGFAKLASVTGYIDFKRGFYIDADAAPTTDAEFDQNDKVRQFTQELRLDGEAGRVDWLVGAYYSWDRVRTNSPGFLDSLFVTHVLITADQTTHSGAVFGQLKFHLTDTLSLVTGLRYTSEHRSYKGGTTDTNPYGSSFLCFVAGACGFPPNPGQHVLTFTDASIDDNNWSWRVGLNYKPSDDTLIYGTIARGVKSGGFFNGVTTQNQALAPYRPEQLTDYEVGIKTRGFGRTVMLDASVFYYDYKDLQTQIFTNVGAVSLIKLGNIDEAKVYGLDASLTWKPVAGLTLNGALGLLHTELGAFLTAGPGGIVSVPKGNKLPNAPQVTFSGTARYQWQVSDGWTMSAQGTAHYSDKVFKEALNTAYLSADRYWIFDARLALASDDGHWELALWGKNLGDEQYVAQATDDGLGMGYRIFNAPRTYGVSLSRRF